MPCGQRLDRRDAGNDVVAQVDMVGDLIENPQCAVVERRIPPRQERPDPVGAEFGLDGVGPEPSSRLVPVGDSSGVLTVGGARRVGQLDEAVVRFSDEATADLAA